MSENREAVRALYDRVAATYAGTFRRICRYERRVRRFLRRAVVPGTRVLDVGCGPGHLTASLPPSVQVVGADLAPSMIELAKRRRPAGHYLVHDYHQPFPRELGEFDVVMAVGCLDFCAELDGVLPHFAAATREGGRLFFSVEESRRRRHHPPERSWQGRTPEGVVHLYFHGRGAVEAALGRAGLRPIAYASAPGWRYLPTRRNIDYGFWEAVRV